MGWSIRKNYCGSQLMYIIVTATHFPESQPRCEVIEVLQSKSMSRHCHVIFRALEEKRSQHPNSTAMPESRSSDDFGTLGIH